VTVRAGVARTHAAVVMDEVHDDVEEYRRAGGRIDRLEVENFKSYRGAQLIGPFKAFTAIVGPNGSGKSNLMDAISFVLGVRTAQLRGSLRELLYAGGGGGDDNAAAAEVPPRRGHVKLVYVDDEGAEVHFSRVIQPSGADPEGGYASVYKIDDRTVTWDAYARRLAGYGILVKVRNFLVFQVRRKQQSAPYTHSCALLQQCRQHVPAPSRLAQTCWATYAYACTQQLGRTGKLRLSPLCRGTLKRSLHAAQSS
jgi:energy-coupling factor transporter ATP-binding protein EcfA2